MILLLVFIRSETQYLSRYSYLPTVDVCRYLVQYYILYSLYFMVRVAANLFVLLIDNFLFKLGLLTADMAKTMDTICTFAEILSLRYVRVRTYSTVRTVLSKNSKARLWSACSRSPLLFTFGVVVHAPVRTVHTVRSLHTTAKISDWACVDASSLR